MFKKKLTAVAITAALTLGSAFSAFASNLTGPFIYRDAALTSQMPSHAQQCISKIITEDTGAGNSTNVYIYVKTVKYGFLKGRIKSITINGETAKVDKGTDRITFKKLNNSLIAANGGVRVSFELSILGHKGNIKNVYLDVNN